MFHCTLLTPASLLANNNSLNILCLFKHSICDKIPSHSWKEPGRNLSNTLGEALGDCSGCQLSLGLLWHPEMRQSGAVVVVSIWSRFQQLPTASTHVLLPTTGTINTDTAEIQTQIILLILLFSPFSVFFLSFFLFYCILLSFPLCHVCFPHLTSVLFGNILRSWNRARSARADF